ncbi:MAG: GNAT family N-acetyltransferase, partial [Candidatus Thorarchaeota archaeon]
NMKDKQFIIRSVNEEDEALLKNMYLSDIEENHEKASRFAYNLIHKVKTLACINGEGVIGTISWDIRGGLEDGVIELVALGTSPSYHRRGIGRELILAMINEAQAFFTKFSYKLRVIYLFMEKNNEVGREFYKNMGFREIFTIPSFLPHDDVVFWIKYY